MKEFKQIFSVLNEEVSLSSKEMSQFKKDIQKISAFCDKITEVIDDMYSNYWPSDDDSSFSKLTNSVAAVKKAAKDLLRVPKKS